MAVPRSPPPGRNQSGYTSDWPYGPLADSGMGNPAFYHQYFDDFDTNLAVTGYYTITAASGSVAHTAGDGGLALFTTGSVAANFAEIQVPTADFTLPQGALAGKKFFFLTRLQISDVTNSILIAGVTNVTTTPFTAISDGIYFNKPNLGTTLNIVSAIGSVLTTTAIPAASNTLANATNIDLGFYVDWYGNINAFVSSNMVGYAPQSGTGSSTPTRGFCVRVAGASLSTANLSPMLAISNGTAAAAKTMTVDFLMAQKER